MVRNNRENRLKELKEHFLDRKHPHYITDYSFTKIFQPKLKNKIKNRELETCFQKKEILLSTRQPPNLRKLLTTAKFERLPIPKQIKQAGFFPSVNCIYHKNGFFKECLSFSFKSRNKLMTWHNKRFFSGNSKDVLYVLFCNNCDFLYIGQT